MHPFSSAIASGTLPSESIIRASIKKENFLGSGGNAEVYAVDLYPNFAVKIPRALDISKAEKFGAPKMIDDLRFEGRNFGQPVAVFENGISILLKQQGKPVGVPAHLRDTQETPVNQEDNDGRYEESMKGVAAMPQEAYVQLIRDLKFLNHAGKRINPSKSNDLLCDIKNGKFNLVGLSDRKKDEEENTPSGLLTLLLDISYARRTKVCASEEKHGKMQVCRRAIFFKLLDACGKLGEAVAREEELNSKIKDLLEGVGFSEGTPERREIETRIINVDKLRKESREI
jgi:hypothetical protein